MPAQYTSPLRPLDIGYASRVAEVEIDWDATEIGEWHPGQIYGFATPLPERIVKQFQLKFAGGDLS